MIMRMLRCLAMILTLAPVMGSAQDFDDGMVAYSAGDPATAARVWMRLAEQGDAEAQLEIGSMYSLGWGVPQDFAEAAKWFRLSAEQGNAAAQGDLAYCYQKGKGVPQDYVEAAKWFRLSAEQGDTGSQHSLGSMYRNGQGVPQDNVSAHMRFNLASINPFLQDLKKRKNEMGYPGAAATRVSGLLCICDLVHAS
jgi:hypothetical protein